jgi:putative ABC transport system permease protein
MARGRYRTNDGFAQRIKRWSNLMNRLIEDIRYALRQFRNNPGFTLTAVITLALGIGANTAIFTLLDQALLRSLPVNDPAKLVQLQFTGSDTGHLSDYGGDQHDYYSYPMYRDLRDKNAVFSGLIATTRAEAGVLWDNSPGLAKAELVSGNYFDVLGVHASAGRLFVQSDDVQPEANPIVALSYGYWQRRFGADRGVIGQSVLVNGHPFTVVGVAPPSFQSVQMGYVPDVFVPITMKKSLRPDEDDLLQRRSRWLNIIGRLKPGLTLTQAQSGIDPLWHSLRADELNQMGHHSDRFRNEFLTNSHMTLLDGAKGFSPLRNDVRTPLLVLMGMVGLVVLMACANVASLLLVRAAGRIREMSIRYALGAERARVARQLLTEGLLLGLMSGALGIALAPTVSAVLQRGIVGSSDDTLPFSNHPDPRILAFNFGLAFIVSLLFSLAPVMQFWQPNLTPALKQQTTTAAGGATRLRSIFACVQIGLSLVLLFGAGLFARTLYNLKNTNVGFITDHLIVFTLDPSLSGYDLPQIPGLYKRVLGSLNQIPGVTSAAATTDPELMGDNTGLNITVAGYTEKEEEDMNIEKEVVSPGYFSTLGMPLIAGRGIGEQDGPDAAQVAVVNEAFAKHWFGSASIAIGHQFHDGGGNPPKDVQLKWLTIVGVVKDAKHSGIRDDVSRTAFYSYLQEPPTRGIGFFVRTQQSPEAVISEIRQTMQRLDSKLVPDSLKTMDDQISEDLNSERTLSLLAISFGSLAALLAAIGLYGMLAFATAQRTREIGIRMALGSTRSGIVKLVLAGVGKLLAVSLAIAIPAALLLSHLVKSQLFGVSAHDPGVMIGAAILVVTAALLAAALPSRRASSVNPSTTLRYE